MAIKNKLATQDFAKEVVYAPATLTPEQKAQAQKNIGMPEITAADAGLVLGVSEQGTWELSLVSGGGGGEGVAVQPDWNQTDDTQPDFIKNKPFGKVYSSETLINTEATFTFDEEQNTWLSAIPFATDARFNVGKNYTVLYDGTEYSCECFNVMHTFNCVGNTLFAGMSDNGIPFIFIEDTEGLLLGQSCFVCMTMDEDDPSSVQALTHNIQLSFEGLITQKIPAVYLNQPDWSINDKTNGGYIKNRPFGHLSAGTVVVEETVSCSGSDGMGFFTELRIGTHAYIVEFDGVTYELIGVATNVNGGEQIELSYNGDDGIAFSIVKNYYNVAYNILSAAEGSHTVKITLAEDAIEKIDTKYLPDDIGGNSLPEVTINDSGKVMTVVGGTWVAQTPASGLPEVTTTENDKVLKVVNGAWAVADSLPAVTSDDAGKFLRVSTDGLWIVESIPNAEEASF